jgi:hypothetical protein
MKHSRGVLLRMVGFLLVVAAVAAILGHPLINAFLGNPGVNGIILVILVFGVGYIFYQVLRLDPAIDWIESFRHGEARDNQATQEVRAPRMLAPMARMLGARQGRRVSLSASSLQTLLDGISSRRADAREASR